MDITPYLMEEKGDWQQAKIVTQKWY